jgi:threonine synthase
MWKAFAELKELGWLTSPKMPRLFSCQSSGCAPIVNAFDKGQRFAEPPANPHTLASGLRVPKAVGDFMILDAVHESNGAAIAAEESRLTEWMHLATRLEGISLCPEAAACIGAIEHALERGLLSRDDHTVIFNTGAAQKYLEVIDRPLPAIDHRNIDWSAIEGASR